ncbi:FAM172 family protein homolog CG10038 [Sitodiplosis mosellana]|uniref:FAM172 family protein homolog CG10038 n=1 Tax=Sitodiplosis mosellana TaxID=263140 RepID=UPI0024445D70|nr:FAM172 family protein homolog CG10038 [Sitodiplosis mosellana]
MFSTKLFKCFSASRQVFSLYSHRLSRVIGQRASTTMSSEFPTTLEGFGYGFNDVGQLRQIDPTDGSITDDPFKFEVSSDSSKNQAHYEALGEVLTEHVYQMLLDIGLHKIWVPSPETPKSSFVFGTKTDFANTKKLLFLIHGSGVVRAGQWSRSLIINQSTDHGTQIPYIKRAIELGYDVLVTNTNHNSRIEGPKRIRLEGNESPEEHIISVWEQLIEPVYDSIESFAVVAHSYGGVVTLRMARNYPNAFLEKCFAIGFTDSVHYAGSLSRRMFEWFNEHARNYVTSNAPLDTELNTRSSDIPCFSAGHTKHEWTSWACMEALFPYLEEQYQDWLETKKGETGQKAEQVGKEESAENDEDDDKDKEEGAENAEEDEEKEKAQADEQKGKPEEDEKDETTGKEKKREDL